MIRIWTTTTTTAAALALLLVATTTGWAQDAAAPATESEAEAGTEAETEGAGTPDGGAGDGAGAGGRVVDGIAPAPGELAMGRPVGEGEGIGTTYIAGTSGAWEQRCIKAGDGRDPCQLYQLLTDQQGNPVAEISVFGLPEGQQAAAGATIITPLETLLTQQITLAVDAATGKRYPFTFCAENGCFARVGFTEADIASFKRGAQATLTIVPAAAPDQQIDLSISLNGFTAGYDEVNEANGN